MKEMTTREIQMVCLDILKEVHQFCVKNSIKYSLSGGSLLGAIRHNGFIPWDDDADIQMPRPDYDRFVRTFKSDRGYRVFACEVDGYDKTRLRLGRVCEMNRTIMDSGPRKWTEIEHGIGIDIEPCDGAPDTKREALCHIKKRKILGSLYDIERKGYASWNTIMRYESITKRFIFIVKKVISIFFPHGYWLKKLVECQKEYDWNTSNYFMASIHYGISEWQPKENMKDYVLHPFEDTQLFVMSGYDANLTSLYGSNYMELPPPNKRVVPHSLARRFWRE